MNSDVLIRLERFIATLKQEELEKQANTCADNKWVIKKGDKYYSYSAHSGVSYTSNTDEPLDIDLCDTGNVFLFENEAKDYGKWLSTDTKVRRFARDYNGDVEYDELHHELYYDGRIKDYYRNYLDGARYYGNDITFKDSEYFEDIIIKIGYEDLKHYLTYIKPVYDLE